MEKWLAEKNPSILVYFIDAVRRSIEGEAPCGCRSHPKALIVCCSYRASVCGCKGWAGIPSWAVCSFFQWFWGQTCRRYHIPKRPQQPWSHKELAPSEMSVLKKVKPEICGIWTDVNRYLWCFISQVLLVLPCVCTSQGTMTLIILPQDQFWQQSLLTVPKGCSCLSLLLVQLINVGIWLIMHLIMSRLFVCLSFSKQMEPLLSCAILELWSWQNHPTLSLGLGWKRLHRVYWMGPPGVPEVVPSTSKTLRVLGDVPWEFLYSWLVHPWHSATNIPSWLGTFWAGCASAPGHIKAPALPLPQWHCHPSCPLLSPLYFPCAAGVFVCPEEVKYPAWLLVSWGFRNV